MDNITISLKEKDKTVSYTHTYDKGADLAGLAKDMIKKLKKELKNEFTLEDIYNEIYRLKAMAFKPKCICVNPELEDVLIPMFKKHCPYPPACRQTLMGLPFIVDSSIEGLSIGV